MRTEPDLFYTRRIGRAPQGYPEAEYVARPAATTILGAAKFTGKSASGWSVGVLEAVTGAGAGAVAGRRRRAGRQEVEPLTNYFVLRAHRDRTRAGYGMLFTAVNRDLGDAAARVAALALRLRRRHGRLRLPRRAEGLGGVRADGREPGGGRPRGDRGAATGLGPLLPAARPARAAPRPDRAPRSAGGRAASTSTASRAPSA